MEIPFGWERISLGTWRAKVFGGWIVKSVEHGGKDCSESMVFIKDVLHRWEVLKV